MRKKYILAGLLAMFLTTGTHAQRVTDKLDRGLVAVKTSGGVFCSWRVNHQQHLYHTPYNKRSRTDYQFQGYFRVA